MKNLIPNRTVYLLIFLLGCISFLSSCKKDKNLPIPCREQLKSNKLLSKITYTSDIPTNFEPEEYYFYDSIGRISRVIDSNDGDLSHIYEYRYLNNGEMVEKLMFDAISNLQNKLVLEYNSDNKLIKQTKFIKDTHGYLFAKYYSAYFYDDDCNLIKEDSYFFYANKWILEESAIYKWSGNNIQQISHYDSIGIFEEEFPQYDHNLCYKIIPGFSPYDYCKNNVVKVITDTYWDDVTISSSYVSYLLKYNEFNLIESVTIKFGDGHFGNLYSFYEYY